MAADKGVIQSEVSFLNVLGAGAETDATLLSCTNAPALAEVEDILFRDGRTGPFGQYRRNMFQGHIW